MSQIFIITIVGAESSGKTTLAMKLAEHFRCPWVPEYSREFLASLPRPYTADDLSHIARHEQERIAKAVNQLGDLPIVSPEMKGADLNDEIVKEIMQTFFGELAEFQDASSFSGEEHNIKILIIDGGMLTIRMWARIKYGIDIPLVEDVLQNDMTDLYILCKPRREWEPDPLREAPGVLDRSWIYNQYLKELYREEKPFIVFPPM